MTIEEFTKQLDERLASMTDAELMDSLEKCGAKFNRDTDQTPSLNVQAERNSSEEVYQESGP